MTSECEDAEDMIDYIQTRRKEGRVRRIAGGGEKRKKERSGSNRWNEAEPEQSFYRDEMVDSYGRNRRCATGHLPVSRHDEIRTTFLAPGIETRYDKSLTPRQQKPCVLTARRGATRQDEIASLMSHATRSHVSLVVNSPGQAWVAQKATETERRMGYIA